MWPHPLLQGMRYPGDPFAGLPEGAELPEGSEVAPADVGAEPPVASEEAPTARPRVASRESAFERWRGRVELTVMALFVVAWVGCTGNVAIAVLRSQRSINRAITSLEADGFRLTREHVDVLEADGSGRLSPESARAMCRADFIDTFKIRQGVAHDPLPAEFAAVFEATDVPPFREYMKRPDWWKRLLE